MSPPPTANGSPARSETWVSLGSIGTLLEALDSVCEPHELFPATAVPVAKGAVAVALRAEQVKAVENQAAQRGWKLTALKPETCPAGTPVPLSGLLPLRFDPIDVNARAMDGPPLPWREYLLASNTPENAQLVLARLLGSFTRGLTVRPLAVPRPPAGGPFLFWHVRGRAPVRPAIEAAHAAYWGPVAETVTGGAVFGPWGRSVNLPASILERIDWGVGPGVVLLGPGERQVLTVPVPDPAPRFEELAAVADFRVEHRPATVAMPAKSAEPRFPVNLRLVTSPQPRTPSERIRELQLEIAYRRDLIERLQEEREESDPLLPPVYEPVFVYLAEKGQVPAGLRRLLIEWCDQAELRELKYLRLAAGALPLDPYWASREVHLLATQTALTGQPAPDGRSLWLRDYAPADGAVFRVLPEWLPFGLRLFIPDDARRLELYPELRPDVYPEFRAGQVTAARLGEALLPEGVTAEGHLVLLVDERSALNAEPHPVALPVPVREFRPLVEALPWECTVEVRAEPAAIRGEAQRARDEFLAAVEQAFARAATGAAVERVTAVLAEFVRELQAVNRELTARRQTAERNQQQFDRELARRRERLDQLRAGLAALDRHLDDVNAAVGTVRTGFGPLATALSAAGGDLRQVAALHAEAQTLATRLAALSLQARQMTERYRRLAAPAAAQPAAPPPAPPGGVS